MSKDLESCGLNERFDHLLNLIPSERFLKMQGIGNEVPFFICPFDPSDTVEVEKRKDQLIKRLKQVGTVVLEVNLYDLVIDILQKRGLWDRILKTESEVSKSEFKELLQGVLDAETHLIPAIAMRMQEHEFAVMFLTGVGEVFPYIRSHNLLNNLQSKAKDRPTVIFFPGGYTHSPEKGASLDLFSRLHDDKYYRAFNIFHCQA